MGDLDLNLINEFASRRAFYDKSSPHYKDKLFIESAWNEISAQLGYEASLLKDRMYQLRNRYNLEKRKIETTKSDACPVPKSTWPLFYHLNFLDGHIRPRKSYKSMMKVKMDDDVNYYPRNSREYRYLVSGGGGQRRDRGDREQEVDGEADDQIKTEVISESEDEVESESAADFVNPSILLDDSHPNIESTESYEQAETIRPNSSNTNQFSNASSTNTSHIKAVPTIKRPLDYCSASYEQPSKTSKKTEKFQSFGQFVAASLSDLPEEKALDLVEKFTLQLVRVMRDNV